MEFLDSIRQVKANWQPYKKWEAQQDDKEFQRQELHKRVHTSKEDLEMASQYGRTLIESINIMDQYATDKAEDVEMASKLAINTIAIGLMGVGMGAMAGVSKIPSVKKYLSKIPNNSIKKQMIRYLTPFVLPMIAMPVLTTKFAGYEKEAARTARYQAREEKLKDSKNFVIFNKEQIDKAKEIAKTLPDPIEKKKSALNPISNYNDSIKSVKTIIQDHKNYLKWKEDHLKKEKIKIDNLDKMNISPEELIAAKKDQDNLLRTIRKVEVNSQTYLSNVEMACNMVLAFDILLGAGIGGIVTGVTTLLQKAKILSTSSKAVNIIKKTSPIVTPLLLVIATVSYATKLQKEAARVGRFKAKQDLLKDPHNFLTYDDKQLDSVKDLKAPSKPQKGFVGKFKDDIKFLIQMKRDYKEYEKYKKGDYKEEQKLQEALMKIDVSKEQIQNAKTLQKNAFMSFEKVDEMSQRYVADVEAAADITKQYTAFAANTCSQIALLYLLLKPSNKKIDIATTINKTYPLLFPAFVNVPMEIKSIQIEKEAGKIGIMKAMQDLEDPRYFVQKENK